jgi:hypothetical protein
VAATLSELPGVQVVIPFSGCFPVTVAGSVKSIMFVGGTADSVITFEGWAASATGCVRPPAVKKRLLGITNGGHLAPTELCQTNDLGKSALEEMVERGVCGVHSTPHCRHVWRRQTWI